MVSTASARAVPTRWCASRSPTGGGGRAMLNSVGGVAVTRGRTEGTSEAGFRVLIAGGVGAARHAARALREFTSGDDLLATIKAVLRVIDHAGSRSNKLRARMKRL